MAALTGSLVMPDASYAGYITKEWFMPDEGDSHKRTWMAFGASADIWGRDLLPEVHRNLATLVRTIARYETGIHAG